MQLRRECLTRLETERNRLLDCARAARTGGESQLQDALKELVHASSTHLSKDIPPDGDGALSRPQQDEQGLLGSLSANKYHPNDLHLSIQEYEDLMQTLEASLNESLLIEELEYLELLEQQEIDQMLETHFTHLNLDNELDESYDKVEEFSDMLLLRNKE